MPIVKTGERGLETFDEDLTRSDLYDSELGADFMTPGTQMTSTPEGNPVTGPTISRGAGQGSGGGPAGPAPVPDALEEEPMSDEDILAVVDAELSNCSAQYSGELAENRIAALRYYDGNMPPAPAGRSQHVSMDVADVVEWTLPQVMDALCSTGILTLDADNEQDEQQAQLEVDACEQVIHKENEGFVYYMSCVKDALLQKNGVGKVYWDEATEVTVESYEALTEMEVQTLLNPQDGSQVSVVAGEERPMEGVVDSMTGQPLVTYDVTINRYRSNDGVKVEPLPPEEFLVARDHNSIFLDNARFTAHKRLVTESELIAEGWDPEMVRDLPTYSVDETGEREERRSLEDEKDFGYDASDRAVRRIQVIECYALIDRDRDGIAELLQVHVAGTGSLYLMGWENVDCNPFVGTTGILLTHKFYGKSLYDRCKEIQDQKTDLVRQIQDNIRHQNNSRLAVVAGQVNLDDLLTSRPGGVVRQKAPGMIEQLASPQLGDMGYRQLEYLDNVRTGRVGVSPDTASVAEAIAGDTAHGLERLMSAKEELTGLMIRLFAFTLVKGTVFKVRRLLQKYRHTPMHFKVRNQWQVVNPAEWASRTGATIAQALGNGDRLKRTRGLQAIITQQQVAVEAGGLGTIVTEKNIWHALTDFADAMNVGDASSYWQDPEGPEAQRFRQLQQQQLQQQQGMQMQMQQAMLQATFAIESNKEMTKRMQLQQKALDDQSDLLYQYKELADQMKAKYTELELTHGVNIPGEGMEGEQASGTTG